MKQLLTILLFTIMTSVSYSQTWIDATLYPFENKYLRIEAGNMHYIDEGKGEIILFVHGTPTWSFLYRNFIKELSKEYRCIAIDHLGFGLSEKPDSVSGTPEWHANNLSEVINKLDLQDITLVVHDFGGPIGLGAGIANSDRIKRIILFNSWLWATDQQKEAKKIDKIVNSGLGRFLYLTMNFSPKVLLKKGFANKKYLSKQLHAQYIKPFPTKRSRVPLLNLAKTLVGSSGWYQNQWEQLDQLSNKEWLILWGIKDDFISMKYLKKWQDRLTNAETKEFECGHFVQEEKAIESIKAIADFMSK
ncbi:alpha/beta fold hydrolase [Marivirga arenosa]|uniref:Alpha/beta fold hydrolase n=1 Tax=Marivirga arenosa TaxID=3059076 RepID=A0AA52F1M2_9BACT|nr:alpha/beta fold hydrolase [Marivirga sp. BKB1-2]WNB18864.1 alpha/beta fold hydrolase [Marivirga sp. BKB1-2]